GAQISATAEAVGEAVGVPLDVPGSECPAPRRTGQVQGKREGCAVSALIGDPGGRIVINLVAARAPGGRKRAMHGAWRGRAGQVGSAFVKHIDVLGDEG